MEVAQTREGIPMKKRLFRFAAPAALAGALVGGSVVMAAPAQADTSDCTRLLRGLGYRITQERVEACELGSSGGDWAVEGCMIRLGVSGVKSDHTGPACREAAY
ncbi:hypothetical protein GCM10022245_45390 [Streptomyces mayteni]